MITIDADVGTVSADLIKMLKGMAGDHPRQRSRVLLSNEDSGVQEMVIVLKKGSYIRPHRHPKHKSESYHVIEGELEVRLFNEDGTEHRTIKLNAETPLYRLQNGWYHQPVPVSDWVVYHETYQGKFKKEKDVEYGPWATPEAV